MTQPPLSLRQRWQRKGDKGQVQAMTHLFETALRQIGSGNGIRWEVSLGRTGASCFEKMASGPMSLPPQISRGSRADSEGAESDSSNTPQIGSAPSRSRRKKARRQQVKRWLACLAYWRVLTGTNIGDRTRDANQQNKDIARYLKTLGLCVVAEERTADGEKVPANSTL